MHHRRFSLSCVSLPGKRTNVELVDGASGSVVPPEIAIVDYGLLSTGVMSVSGLGGFIALQLRFAYVSNLSSPWMQDVHLRFTVDGVASELSTQIAPADGLGEAGVCAHLGIVQSVRVFVHRSVTVAAVLATPCVGGLCVCV